MGFNRIHLTIKVNVVVKQALCYWEIILGIKNILNRIKSCGTIVYFMHL